MPVIALFAGMAGQPRDGIFQLSRELGMGEAVVQCQPGQYADLPGTLDQRQAKHHGRHGLAVDAPAPFHLGVAFNQAVHGFRPRKRSRDRGSAWRRSFMSFRSVSSAMMPICDCKTLLLRIARAITLSAILEPVPPTPTSNVGLKYDRNASARKTPHGATY